MRWPRRRPTGNDTHAKVTKAQAEQRLNDALGAKDHVDETVRRAAEVKRKAEQVAREADRFAQEAERALRPRRVT
jgi:hypothetical protein